VLHGLNRAVGECEQRAHLLPGWFRSKRARLAVDPPPATAGRKRSGERGAHAHSHSQVLTPACDRGVVCANEIESCWLFGDRTRTSEAGKRLRGARSGQNESCHRQARGLPLPPEGRALGSRLSFAAVRRGRDPCQSARSGALEDGIPQPAPKFGTPLSGADSA
jgi:hypothetical protein